ncbi:MAG: L,D-transpeptidase [Spirochaetota bacterium]|nr:L,D-transpeptidase [Spirochaetota bacterium]
MIRTIILFISLIIISCNSREEIIKRTFQGYNGRYLIYVCKSDYTLKVYDRDFRIMTDYKIGYGLNPDKRPKLYSGDKRTPEGVYRIIEILSMDADKNSNAYKKLKSMNQVYFRAKDGHYKFGKKDIDLGDNAYGPRFFRLDYPNLNDKHRYKDALQNRELPLINQRTPSIGSGIAIHGNNDITSIGHLSSSGCIRMYNDDIVELGEYIQIHTPVIISRK